MMVVISIIHLSPTRDTDLDVNPIKWLRKWNHISWIINSKTQIRIFSYIQSGNGNPRLSLCLPLLLVCGDIEINPGPAPSVYHCGFCELPVDWSDVAVACDECSIWYHKSCLEMSTSKFQSLNCSNVSWISMKCCTMNTEPHLFNSFEIILENSFAPLDDNAISNTIVSIDSLFSPTYASSPQSTHSNRPSHATANRSPRHGSKPDLPAKSNNNYWRSMVVNVNHLHHKRAVFESCTTSNQM